MMSLLSGPTKINDTEVQIWIGNDTVVFSERDFNNLNKLYCMRESNPPTYQNIMRKFGPDERRKYSVLERFLDTIALIAEKQQVDKEFQDLKEKNESLEGDVGNLERGIQSSRTHTVSNIYAKADQILVPASSSSYSSKCR